MYVELGGVKGGGGVGMFAQRKIIIGYLSGYLDKGVQWNPSVMDAIGNQLQTLACGVFVVDMVCVIGVLSPT